MKTAFSAEREKPDHGGTRVNATLGRGQSATLDAMVKVTGLPKPELVRHAIALLNVAVRAKRKGLELALINDNDDVVAHIASTM